MTTDSEVKVGLLTVTISEFLLTRKNQAIGTIRKKKAVSIPAPVSEIPVLAIFSEIDSHF